MSKVDFVQFLPTTHSEVLAKKVNFQFEKKLETQLRGIEREQKFKRCIIEKTNTTFQRNLNVKMRRQRSLTTQQGGCLQFVEDSTSGEIFFNLNRSSAKNTKDTDRYQNIRFGGSNETDAKKHEYVHRSISRSISEGKHHQQQQQTPPVKIPTAIPKRLTQSFDHGKKPLTRVRSATSMDLGRRYDRWCTSLEEMDSRSTYPTKELADNSTQTPTMSYVKQTLRSRCSSTSSDIQEIKLDVEDATTKEKLFSENQVLPRLPDKEKPVLRRQRKVCRVRSLPNHGSALSSNPHELPEFLGTKLAKENSKILPRMSNPGTPITKPGLKLTVKISDLNNNDNRSILSDLNIADSSTPASREIKAVHHRQHKSVSEIKKKAWHEAEDVLPDLVIKQEQDKNKLRSTKSLQ